MELTGNIYNERKIVVTFSFEEVCEALTGKKAIHISLPEKQADWDYVARQLVSGGAVLDQHPEWVINPTEAMQTFGYDREDFEKKFKHQNLTMLFYYLTSYENDEEILDTNYYNRKAMNSLYIRLARACLKCHCPKVSPTAWLKEHELGTFSQFYAKEGD